MDEPVELLFECGLMGAQGTVAMRLVANWYIPFTFFTFITFWSQIY